MGDRMAIILEDDNQRQRQRKFHRRSRKGCDICKSKHLRCDEVKPLCSYCLKHGLACKYPPGNPDGQNRNRTRASKLAASKLKAKTPEEPVVSVLDPTPKDWLIGTSYHLPETSRSLFELFAHTRVLHTTRVQRSESFMVHRALADPGFQHAAILMTALQWVWETDDTATFAVPYLHHKLQAIRYVNEQLANPTGQIDGTVAAVASLALVENTMGSMGAVACHLQGLAKMTELHRRKRKPQRPGLLCRMILMATRSVARRPVWDMLDISRTDYVHQSVIISLLRVAIRPLYSVFLLSGASTAGDESQSNAMVKVSPPFTTEDATAAMHRSVDAARSDFLACFLYLYVILQEQAADPFLLNWFIEQMLADVCRTEEPMQRGEYSSSAWFWTVVFGGCVVSAVRTTTELEAEQMQSARAMYMDKIRLASQVLRISDWEGAKTVLRLFAWEDDFDGEAEVQALWNEAMWQHSCEVASS